jgi:hypothetical protein
MSHYHYLKEWHFIIGNGRELMRAHRNFRKVLQYFAVLIVSYLPGVQRENLKMTTTCRCSASLSEKAHLCKFDSSCGTKLE